MASQEEQVQGEQPEPTAAEDTAKFAGAWDDLEAEEAGQSATDAERHEAEGEQGKPKPEDEAGQGAAEAGQPDAGTTPAADAKQASREEIPDDVLANADPRLKARLEQLETEKRKARNAARSNGSRLAQALNELSSLQQKLAPKKSDEAEEGAPAPTKDERMEQLRRDYPEVAEPILDKMQKLEERVETLQAGATAKAESAVVDALDDEYEALLERHSDLPAIIAAPEYAEWVKGQAPAIQRIVQDNAKAVVSAEDAALVFDKFKLETGFGRAAAPSPEQKAAEERRQDQLDAGRTATGRNPTPSSDARKDGGTYDDAWDELDRNDRRKAASRR